ncbi:MAG: YabP/YqfC family sporulation protein [Bacilli bacterium]|nr:YabP/YqfC family sporulation protein [Bacilli bacterium]
MSGIINYIRDNEFRINIYENKVNIVNYIDLLSMEEERISLTSSIGRVIIKGNNLSVKKLLNKELLIVGKINNIEIGD